MGGRAVGGIGAGCAGFGVLGVLASVVIVVWLASRGLDPAGDLPDLASATSVDADTAPSLTLTPDLALTEGAALAVAVASVPPGPIEIVACTLPATDPEAVDAPTPSLPGAERCSLPLATGDADASGTAVVELATPRTVVTADRAIPATDCATAAATCVLGVRAVGGDVLAVGALDLSA